MDISQLLSTAATVAVLAAGIALTIVLAVVPTWLRYDAERAELAEASADARPARTTTPTAAPHEAATPLGERAGHSGRSDHAGHALAA